MAQQTNQLTTYKDNGSTGTIRRQVNESFVLMSPKSFPELSLFSGGNEEKPALDNLDLDGGKITSDAIEWYEDALRPVVFTLNADINNSVTAFVTNPASDAGYLLVGMVIQMESEQMLVTANGNNSTGSVTVSRAYGGTSAASHTAVNVAAAGGVLLVTRVHEEGTDATSDPWDSPTRFYNYWQEFLEEIKISDAERAMDRYTMDPGGYLDRQILKKTKEIYKQMTLSFYRGARVQGASGTASSTGGIETFMFADHNNNLAAAALTTTHINSLMQEIYQNAGGDMVADTVLCSPANKVKLSTLFSTSSVTVYRDIAQTRGGIVVDMIETDFGALDIVMSTWCPTDRIFFVKKDMIKFGPLKDSELQTKPLATSGTYERIALVGRYAWQIMGSKCHGLVRNFT